LYYRLNVIPLTLPPLRQRISDVKLLVEHFMRQYLGNDAPALSADVLTALQRHAWPGNVRELQNAVERAAILSRGQVPRESDFLLGQSNSLSSQVTVEVISDNGQAAPGGLAIRSGTTVQEMEKALILETLKATENNRTLAAKMLGISIRTLRNKLHEYNFDEGVE
jgi:DNA-binding NtrC family response regulator